MQQTCGRCLPTACSRLALDPSRNLGLNQTVSKTSLRAKDRPTRIDNSFDRSRARAPMRSGLRMEPRACSNSKTLQPTSDSYRPSARFRSVFVANPDAALNQSAQSSVDFRCDLADTARCPYMALHPLHESAVGVPPRALSRRALSFALHPDRQAYPELGPDGTLSCAMTPGTFRGAASPTPLPRSVGAWALRGRGTRPEASVP